VCSGLGVVSTALCCLGTPQALRDRPPSGTLWLTAPLLHQLAELCREAGGPDWHVQQQLRQPGAQDGAGGPTPQYWLGTDGTAPLPRLRVWTLLDPRHASARPSAQLSEADAVWQPYLSTATLAELLRAGVVDPNETAASTTGNEHLAKGSALLHKVGLGARCFHVAGRCR
jgi:hypothetical protein